MVKENKTKQNNLTKNSDLSAEPQNYMKIKKNFLLDNYCMKKNYKNHETMEFFSCFIEDLLSME